MGMSKAMMEKVMVAKSRKLDGSGTVICGTRYGNVMASRGSVIPLFVEQMLDGQPITVTDPEHDALHDVARGRGGSRAVRVRARRRTATSSCRRRRPPRFETLAQAIVELLGRPNHEVRMIGTRHGEKLYESLLSREERARAEDLGEYFRIPPDGRDLNYAKFVEQGEQEFEAGDDYNSHNTTRLDVEAMKALLMKLRFMQAIVRGEHVEPED